MQVVEREQELTPGPAEPSGHHLPGPTDADRILSGSTVVHTIPGRVRLRVPPLKSYPSLAESLETLVKAQPGVTDVTVNQSCASLTVHCDPVAWTSETLCRFLQGLTREEIKASRQASAGQEQSQAMAEANWMKAGFLAPSSTVELSPKGDSPAGAPIRPSYSIVGYASLVVGTALLAVPMVPGIPFLLLSSYCFAKGTIAKTTSEPERSEQVSKTNE